MRNLIMSIALFFAVLLLASFSLRHLKEIENHMLRLTTRIEIEVSEKEWKDAYDSSIEFLETWEKESKIIAIFVHHEELDNINNEIWKLTQYTKCEDRDDSLASVHTLKFLIKHIINLEKINMQNIL